MEKLTAENLLRNVHLAEISSPKDSTRNIIRKRFICGGIYTINILFLCLIFFFRLKYLLRRWTIESSISKCKDVFHLQYFIKADLILLSYQLYKPI